MGFYEREMLRCYGTRDERISRREAARKKAEGIVGAAKPEELLPDERELMRSQLLMLSKESRRVRDEGDVDALAKLSDSMARVYSALHGQSQSFYGGSLPFAVQLPIEDLFALYEDKAYIASRLYEYPGKLSGQDSSS